MTKEAHQTQIIKERRCSKEKSQAEAKYYNLNDDLECIVTNNEFCSVDQMLTPRHASFIDEYEYQKLLMDLF